MNKSYKKIATETRKTVLKMVYDAQSSHIGSNFSCIDILTVLYEKMDPAKDKLVVSKGWVAATVYALAVRKGYAPKEAVKTYCKPGSKYIGLIEPLDFLGAEFSGGSMGLGFPAAVGFALAKKVKGEKGTVYCLMSDGEQAIGTTWESALIASHHQLDNLVVIVDQNGFQAMGRTKDVLDSSQIIVWQDIGWNLEYINGHNHQEILKAVTGYSWNQPKAVVAQTIKGKGVSFMEDNNLYHYKNLSKEEYQNALKELA